MSLAGYKPAIPGSERLQTHGLDYAATGIRHVCILHFIDWKEFIRKLFNINVLAIYDDLQSDESTLL
jgi:hypothetical protein